MNFRLARDQAVFIETGAKLLVFVQGEKPESQEKTPLSMVRTNTELNPHSDKVSESNHPSSSQMITIKCF